MTQDRTLAPMSRILWLLTAVLTGVYIAPQVIDPDLWWHIPVGRWILSHATVPTADHWNIWGIGLPWRAYSWSNEIVFALIDRHAGVLGLLFAQQLLGVVCAVAFSWVFSRMAGDYFFGLLLGVFATAACFNHFVLRPQTLVWVLLAAVLYIADCISRNGTKREYLVALFAVMMVWANTHLTAALGIFAACMWVLGPRNFRRTAIVAAVGFAGTLVTPYFGGEWLTFFAKSGHPLKFANITEFHPATIRQFSTSFLVVLNCFLFALWHLRPRSFEPLRLVLLGCFVLGGLTVVKFLPFGIVVCCAVIARFWGCERLTCGGAGNFDQAISLLRGVVRKLEGGGLAFLLLALAIVHSLKFIEHPINLQLVPVEAVDFIEKNKLEPPILTFFGGGGYLMYRYSEADGSARALVTIDGRTNVTPELILTRERAMLFGERNWQEYYDSVSPRPTTILWKNESPLVSIFSAGGQWCQAFKSGDDTNGFSVFVAVGSPLCNQAK